MRRSRFTMEYLFRLYTVFTFVLASHPLHCSPTPYHITLYHTIYRTILLLLVYSLYVVSGGSMVNWFYLIRVSMFISRK